MKSYTLKFKNGVQIRDHRLKLGLTQQDFWIRFGVNQSAGSRYEGGRTIPKPVLILVNIAFESPKLSAELVAMLRA